MTVNYHGNVVDIMFSVGDEYNVIPSDQFK